MELDVGIADSTMKVPEEGSAVKFYECGRDMSK